MKAVCIGQLYCTVTTTLAVVLIEPLAAVTVTV
jgi:hypothetical protein